MTLLLLKPANSLSFGRCCRSCSEPGFFLVTPLNLRTQTLGEPQSSQKRTRCGLKCHDRLDILHKLAVNTFLLGLWLWLRFDVHLLGQRLADAAE